MEQKFLPKIENRFSEPNSLDNSIDQNYFKEQFEILADNYEINFSNVKEGKFGKVFTAIDMITGQNRAVKVIKKSKRNPGHVIEILREIEIMQRIDHPNLVNLIEHFEDAGYIYIVMEYFKDGELFERIIENQYFSEKAASIIMKQILSGVYHLHISNIVHRDIKPENILFDGQVVKLIDYGASKILTKNQKMHKCVGTAYYMAPEIIKGDYDKMCDIWSCGVVMYILLCGKPPFDGTSINQIFTSVMNGQVSFKEPEFQRVSQEAINLILAMLRYEPYKRIRIDEALNHP